MGIPTLLCLAQPKNQCLPDCMIPFPFLPWQAQGPGLPFTCHGVNSITEDEVMPTGGKREGAWPFWLGAQKPHFTEGLERERARPQSNLRANPHNVQGPVQAVLLEQDTPIPQVEPFPNSLSQFTICQALSPPSVPPAQQGDSQVHRAKFVYFILSYWESLPHRFQLNLAPSFQTPLEK